MNIKEKQWKCVCNKKAKEFSLCDDCEVKKKLTAFLEEEQQKAVRHFFDSTGVINDLRFIKDHDQRLINTLLDIVGEEIEKKDKEERTHELDEVFFEVDDIKQILTKIKSSL